jgi:hypothetical protein
MECRKAELSRLSRSRPGRIAIARDGQETAPVAMRQNEDRDTARRIQHEAGRERPVATIDDRVQDRREMRDQE